MHRWFNNGTHHSEQVNRWFNNGSPSEMPKAAQPKKKVHTDVLSLTSLVHQKSNIPPLPASL